MADGSKIEWTDATWNPITGCSVISPGCKHCYAMRLAGTRMQHHPSRAGLTEMSKAGPVWNGQVRLNQQWLAQPLGWKRPREIFVCAHADLFHDAVPNEWIDHIFGIMALASHHRFQVLTKRAARMRAYFADPAWRGRVLRQMKVAQPSDLWNGNAYQAERELESKGFLPNVWLGVSVEDQQRAEERIPDLLATPAAVRWLSCEPMLGPIDLHSSLGGTRWIGGQRGCAGASERSGAMHHGTGAPDCPRHLHHHHDDRCKPGLDWVVVGGESGPGARPMHPEWARSLRDQCAKADVQFHFKQWGEWAPYDRGQIDSRTLASPGATDRPLQRFGKRLAGRLLDGVAHDGMPAHG